MKPVKFKEHNFVYAENQPEYTPLPVFKNDMRNPDSRGEVISCWKLSFWERVRVLFSGKIWISELMFGKRLTPILPTTKKSDVLITKK